MVNENLSSTNPESTFQLHKSPKKEGILERMRKYTNTVRLSVLLSIVSAPAVTNIPEAFAQEGGKPVPGIASPEYQANLLMKYASKEQKDNWEIIEAGLAYLLRHGVNIGQRIDGNERNFHTITFEKASSKDWLDAIVRLNNLDKVTKEGDIFYLPTWISGNPDFMNTIEAHATNDLVITYQKNPIKGHFFTTITREELGSQDFMRILAEQQSDFEDTRYAYIALVYENPTDITTENQDFVTNFHDHPDLDLYYYDDGQLYNLLIDPQRDALVHEIIRRVTKDDTDRHITYENKQSDKNPKTRLQSIEVLSSFDRYYTTSFAEDITYMSTFNLLFDGYGKNSTHSIMGRIKKNFNGNGYKWLQFIDPAGHEQAQFLRMCAEHDKLDDFLATMTAEQQAEILKNMVTGLADIEENNTMDKRATMIADIMNYAQTYPNILAPLEQALINGEDAIIQKYQNARTKFEQQQSARAWQLQNILGSLHAPNAVTNTEYFADKQNMYPLEKFQTLSISELFPNDTCYQEHFFASDVIDQNGERNPQSKWDGHLSFASFFKEHGFNVIYNRQTGENIQVKGQGKNSWKKIEETNDYVIISKTQNGRTTIQWANKPNPHFDQTIRNDRRRRDQFGDPTIIVNRGNYFHEDLYRIIESAKLYFSGSGRGARDPEKILSRAPEAQIFATTYRGVEQINNYVLTQLNETLFNTEEIKWKPWWTQTQKGLRKFGTLIQEYAQSYHPPHENLELIVQRAIRDHDKQVIKNTKPVDKQPIFRKMRQNHH